MLLFFFDEEVLPELVTEIVWLSWSPRVQSFSEKVNN